ncbi:MAG: spermine synthase [Opitutaceae bacterium]|nr:spermine synthase [Opitutaceae bacterium]|tara:strand:+ start:1088 stop:1762 length:675 start_codon:yes stop_codon:yes gene_type:complete
MKPHITLAETTTPDGKSMALVEHDGDFSMRVDGRDLMHSSVSASELHLGEIAVEQLRGATEGRVLIGGLGMGFTLKSVLAGVGKNIAVEAVELIPEVVKWNRTFMKDLNGKLLDDPRVTVVTRDVYALLNRSKPNTYDAILLDIDNGPTAMVQKGNARLYTRQGLQQIRRALKAGGRVAIWSASVDTQFEARLKSMNFRIEAVPARLHKNARRSTYTIYVADKA